MEELHCIGQLIKSILNIYAISIKVPSKISSTNAVALLLAWGAEIDA